MSAAWPCPVCGFSSPTAEGFSIHVSGHKPDDLEPQRRPARRQKGFRAVRQWWRILKEFAR